MCEQCQNLYKLTHDEFYLLSHGDQLAAFYNQNRPASQIHEKFGKKINDDLHKLGETITFRVNKYE